MKLMVNVPVLRCVCWIEQNRNRHLGNMPISKQNIEHFPVLRPRRQTLNLVVNALRPIEPRPGIAASPGVH